MAQASRLEILERMAREKPQDAFARYALAMAYSSAGRLEEAAETFDALRVSHPSYLATYYQLGKALEKLGRLDDARAAFRQGIDVARESGNTKTAGELEDAMEQAEAEKR